MSSRYDTYKPSGIDWIGEIPSHWEIKRLRFVCEFRNGYTPSKDNKAFWTDGTIPWYRMEDIRESGRFLSEAKQYITEEAVKGGGLFEADSFILATTATIGEHAMLIVDSLANQQFTNLKIRKSLKYCFAKQYFFYYLYIIDEFCKSSTNTATFPAMNMEDLRNFGVCIPPLAEQEGIAAWLDAKCGEIDAAIAKVDREIELIDELKQSEISRVVTRGLNPDAPLRPSGIDWIGNIPQHWKVCRLKNIAKVVLGKMLLSEPPKGQEYTCEKYLKSRNVGWLELLIDDVDEMWFNNSEKETYELKDGDIIVNEGGDIGKVAVWHKQSYSCYIQNSVHKVTPINGDPRFCAYMLYYLSKKEYFWSIVSQVSIAHLTKEKLSNAPVFNVPLSEQRAIAEYLDKKCAEIDGLKTKLMKKRETLAELRQSLISEVVTGKRKVI